MCELKKNRGRRPNAGFMLGNRRRRWPNIKPTLGERHDFSQVDVNAMRAWGEVEITKQQLWGV